MAYPMTASESKVCWDNTQAKREKQSTRKQENG